MTLLLALPRESAAALLQKAEEGSRSVSARFRMWVLIDGRERLARWGIVAGAWQRFEVPSGRVELYTPTTAYVRDGPGERTLVTPRTTQVDEDGFRLDEHLRALRRRGYELEVSMGETRTEGANRVREVRIDMPKRREREILALNDDDLPIRMRHESLVQGSWRPDWRAEIEYPGPRPDGPEFWKGIDRRKAIDRNTMGRFWSDRLAPFVRTVPLSDGSTLELHDFRTMASGDVFMLYTGPERFGARLTGLDGTRFVRVGNHANEDHHIAGEPRPLKIRGKPVHALWFTPERPGTRSKGRVRLEILGQVAGVEKTAPPSSSLPKGITPARPSKPPVEPSRTAGRGSLTVQPIVDPSLLPAWSLALPGGTALANDEANWRADARRIAAYDRWLNADGQIVEGTYHLDPVAGEWHGSPPREGLRHDPTASAIVARLLREGVARDAARGGS